MPCPATQPPGSCSRALNPSRRAALRYGAAFVLLGGCGGAGGSARSTEARWHRAQTVWREQRELAAGYRLWVSLDPEHPAGARAHGWLHEAEVHYRNGITLIKAERPGAREELAAGKAVAPMDSALYLPLARACRDQGITIRATDYYRRFLQYFPALKRLRWRWPSGAP